MEDRRITYPVVRNETGAAFRADECVSDAVTETTTSEAKSSLVVEFEGNEQHREEVDHCKHQPER